MTMVARRAALPVLVARRVLVVSVLSIAVALAAAAAARAADWMVVSCVNPSGSAAPSQGWSTDIVGIPEPGSTASTACGPGTPMSAGLDAGTPATGGVKEALEYQPPPGSTLVGGLLDVGLGAGSTGSAVGAAAVYEPALVDDQNDAFLVCSAILQPCQNGTDTFTGLVALPAGRGGDLFVNAECAGDAGTSCSANAQDGVWARVDVNDAHLLLSTAAVPQGTGFSGSALQPRASGVAHLVFTATDPGGPGILSATAAIDGQTVFTGTPDTNGGLCAPVGADPATGAPMYDAQQPCPAVETVDLPISTLGLPDGAHRLTVAVTDAAGTSSPVLDQAIDTFNPQRTPVPAGRGRVHARFVLSWRWSARRTVLRSVTVSKLPRHARISVTCSGPRCPKLRVHGLAARHVGLLVRALTQLRLHPADRLRITVRAPERRAERIVLDIRRGHEPRARLLGR
jgi:hypothetical protein